VLASSALEPAAAAMLQWRVNMLALLTLKPALRGDAAHALRLTAGARPCPIRAIAVSGDDAAGWVDDLRPARRAPAALGRTPCTSRAPSTGRTIARVDSIKTRSPREWLHELVRRASGCMNKIQPARHGRGLAPRHAHAEAADVVLELPAVKLVTQVQVDRVRGAAFLQQSRLPSKIGWCWRPASRFFFKKARGCRRRREGR
jgi:hypothetical protein